MDLHAHFTAFFSAGGMFPCYILLQKPGITEIKNQLLFFGNYFLIWKYFWCIIPPTFNCELINTTFLTEQTLLFVYNTAKVFFPPGFNTATFTIRFI